MYPHVDVTVPSDTWFEDLWRRGGQLSSAFERPWPLLSLLKRYEPIGLAQMDEAALMSRTDTKYVISMPQLRILLASLADNYYMLEVEGVRLNHYRTLYFDTPTLELYADHHMGRPARYKVRSRAYLDSGASFLEVKRTTNKGRTLKERISTDTFLAQLTPEAMQFVREHVPRDARSLQAALWNEFMRITLVNKHHPERVTFDLDMRLWADVGVLSLGGVVIAEAKQESLDRDSPLMARMRALGVHPTRFSKYCIGTAMLHPQVKHNRFKPVLRLVYQVMRGDSYVL